ncbi:hypothetical protein N7G274_000955 [Stereocaulon virgatum]|uniref:Uncharacterized protein n=1 Tax=Stereocaulon virgatum TaxID=373712 RepID=A0ABR4AQ91_9LECA
MASLSLDSLPHPQPYPSAVGPAERRSIAQNRSAPTVSSTHSDSVAVAPNVSPNARLQNHDLTECIDLTASEPAECLAPLSEPAIGFGDTQVFMKDDSDGPFLSIEEVLYGAQSSISDPPAATPTTPPSSPPTASDSDARYDPLTPSFLNFTTERILQPRTSTLHEKIDHPTSGPTLIPSPPISPPPPLPPPPPPPLAQPIDTDLPSISEKQAKPGGGAFEEIGSSTSSSEKEKADVDGDRTARGVGGVRASSKRPADIADLDVGVQDIPRSEKARRLGESVDRFASLIVIHHG